MVEALAHPIGERVDLSQSGRWNGGNEIELQGGGTGGEEEKAEGGSDGKKAGAGVFRSKKTEEKSKDKEK